MPIIGVFLNPGSTGENVQELHNQLLALGAVIAPGEQTAKSYGDSTVVAVRVFRQRYGLPAGDAVDLPTGRLMHAASAFSGPGGRVALRAAVREAAAAADTSQPQELYWLARYGTLAGDYQTAFDIARRIPDHPEVRSVIDPILAPPDLPVQIDPGQPPATPPPRPPEVPYPENFYTYRRDFYPLEDVLKDMQRQIAAVGQPPRDASQARSHPLGSPGTAFIQAAVTWFEALKQWQIGNADFNHRRYAAAQAAYDACQSAACDYFSKYYSINIGSGPLTERLSNLIKHLAKNEASWAPVWSKIRWRRGLLLLEELEAWDWPEQPPNVYIPRRFDPSPLVGTTLPPKPDHGLGFIQQYFRPGEFGDDPAAPARQNDLEAPLITLAFVLVPLARAEANRARRQFDAALRDLRWVLDSIVVRTIFTIPFVHVRARLACEFIELPFAKLLLAETMLDKADAEYKARIAAESPPAPDVAAFQGLKAAQTYLAIKDEFKNEGRYVKWVDESRDKLTQQIQQRLAANDTRSQEFQLLGKDVLVQTITSAGPTLPGLDRRVKADERLLEFTPPTGEDVMLETNPRVYVVLLAATARLEQLKAGFNYLGYLDSYVPPWRFQFLLERARYFAEHAKNAQRDYLNFLSNAEREEFQELSTSQNVEMEKSNVRIETARVNQVGLEVAAAQQSKELAELTSLDAHRRLDKYKEFDNYADELFWTLGQPEPVEIVSGIFGPADLVLTPIGDFFSGGAVSNRKQTLVANEQREVEKFNLRLAQNEAFKAADVARAQLAAAEAGLVVAGLQRQAALLRHEFAIQNLNFLRNRILSAEQWYRLVVAIRSVSETYLRYSVELAFLAEQAYEFEADKRINVIRFDYDLSEVGDFLAADFLMRDLDTLEQDFIVNQRQRQQQVRYVLSMAREFPAALEELRKDGRVNFLLRLEQIEKRFPGLYNARVGMVDVLPVALLDSTRFSLDLTHTGSGQMRIKGQPDVPIGMQSKSVFNVSDLPLADYDWSKTPKELWPVKILVNEPETAVFSGLSRQDAASAFPVASSGQRNAFEGRGLAGGWQIDMSARENQVVPESLADLLITFTVSGYHDSGLRKAIDGAKPQTTALTSFLSAQQVFPDAFYDFSRTGRMVWKVPREMLVLTGDLGRLRNIGMGLRPGTPNVHFSRLMTRLRMSFRINETGGVASGVTVFTTIPETSVTQTAPLTVAVRAALNTATELAWDFGDGTPILRTVRSGTTPIAPAEGTHVYAKPGRYVIKLRCVQNDSLSEFRISIVVSRDQKLGDPLIVVPRITFDATAKTITVTTGGAVQQAGRMFWRVGDLTAEGNSATFTLKPGYYTLDFTAVRSLNFRVYGAQRYVKDLAPLPLRGLSGTTNRTFDQNGNETNGTGTPTPLPARNELAKRLFDQGAISPEDNWTFELIPEEILGVPAGTAIGPEELDLSDIQDVVLLMEYDIAPGAP